MSLPGVNASLKLLIIPLFADLIVHSGTDTFWIQNLSNSDILNYEITSTPARHRGVRLILDDWDTFGSEERKTVTTDTVIPVAFPSRGAIAANESVQITVRLFPGGYAPSRPVRSGSWEIDAGEVRGYFDCFGQGTPCAKIRRIVG